MIELKGVYKTFGSLQVLENINLTIEPHKVTAIVGASGAGKSTMLQIMGTLDTPDPGKGEVLYNSQRIDTLGHQKMATFRNRNIGFVFQFHHLLPEFNALENVMIPALAGKKNYAESKARAASLLKNMGLEDRMLHKPTELSGGEQQRVAVARALMNAPGLILADEPSGNLDSTNAQSLHELFFELQEKTGQTFVIVTHNEQLAQRAHVCVKMKDGRIINV